MKQTAMQDLKEDLILSKSPVKNSISIIENEEIKDACMKAVELTLDNIIKRIDDELLEMEKEQIIKVVMDFGWPKEKAEQYYKQTFKSE